MNTSYRPNNKEMRVWVRVRSSNTKGLKNNECATRYHSNHGWEFETVCSKYKNELRGCGTIVEIFLQLNALPFPKFSASNNMKENC